MTAHPTRAEDAAAAFYDNRSLFSDHYLRERLPGLAAWDEDVAGAFETTRALYADRRPILDGLNEARTEEEWIKPLLDILGWSWDVQTSATLHGRLNRPDYTLFADAEAKRAAQEDDDGGAYDYSHAAAIADAKYWERPLDRVVSDARDRLTNANPSFQIVNYLVATGVDWGVLTNGREWRLYSMRARSRIDTYYAVDLARILEEGDEGAFKYFLLFFRAAALQPDARTGRSFLDAVYEGSVDYSEELEAELKTLIFDEVFPELATGFIHARRMAGIDDEGDEALHDVYVGTLRLLYRLLFLLHAEARGLLPVDEREGYHQYSLTRIKRRVAERIDGGGALSAVSTDLWHDLDSLFRIIDRGDAGLNVPRYNGGLFRADHPKNRFFREHAIADGSLYPALDRLARADGEHFIDYKALDVEQLGSIYEGLLEFQLRVGDDGEPYLATDKGERKATGSYYTPHYIVAYIVEHTLGPVLEEREQRFRTLMDEIAPKRARLADIEAKLAADPERADGATTRWTNEKNDLRFELDGLEPRAIDALLGIRVLDPAMGSGHFLVHATDWLTERLIAVLNEFPDNPILARIAAIREQIVDTLAEQGIDVERERLKDTTLLKRMVMKRCIYGVDLNPMATELAKLSLWLDSFTVGAPLSFLDHHLKVGNSLVGTTVGEVREALEAEGAQFDIFGGPFAGLLQATELMRGVAAQTDATFDEVEQSAELYAAFEEQMRPYKGILDLWVSRHFGNEWATELLRTHGGEVLEGLRAHSAGLLQATELMRGVAAQTDATFDEVEQSAELYAAFEEQMRPNKGILDLWVSRHFGNEWATELLRTHGGEVLEGLRAHTAGLPDRQQQTLANARSLEEEKRFFHWELEFPEVFVDLERAAWKENPGFDAVVGNPPYVRQEQVSILKPYLLEAHREVYHGAADLYVYFYKRAMELIRGGGFLSYIVTNKWLRAGYGERLREYFVECGAIESIVDFGHAPIFEEADVFPCIISVGKPRTDADAERESWVCLFPREAMGDTTIPDYVREHGYHVPATRFGAGPWSLERPEVEALIHKIIDSGEPLKTHLHGRPYRGVVTGCNTVFLIDSATRKTLIHEDASSEKIIKPYVRGKDIKRWCADWQQSWMIFARRGIDIGAYPAVEAYLSEFRKRLEPRPADWEGEKWPGRKPGNYEWYEIQDTVDYWRLFEEPKIFYPDIAWSSQFALDRQGRISNNTAYFLPTDSPWLLAVLNSPLMWYLYWRKAVHGKDEALRFFSAFIETIPIASPTEASRSATEATVARLIKLTEERRSVTNAVLHWLRAEFGVKRPGQKLQSLEDLDAQAFVAAVRQRRPKSASRFSPADVATLRNTYSEHAEHLRRLVAEADRLEWQLTGLVNRAYGLTPAEVKLLWETAPPRMPVEQPPS